MRKNKTINMEHIAFYVTIWNECLADFYELSPCQ
jgi:hypothetical protein